MLNSIIGSKSYSCFREDIRSLGLEERWLAFRDEACREKAIEWCTENGVEWEELS